MKVTGVIASEGSPIVLGSILGKGGEGTVYEIQNSSSTVAKIYHKALSPNREEKIQIMARMRTEALSRLTAWPIDLIREKSTGQAIGIIMPRISNRKNIHHLYGPKSRLQDFPKADWRFLVRAATNTARAFAVVHESGCVIGDVNHGSIMVAEDATVAIIDCDSFQVTTPARQFLCEVGIEIFTPPELQGLSFKGVVRTANYDNFGLAVMIFHLLFMGRHPFAGRFNGAGEMPIARAIKECRFPYGANQKKIMMSPPPGTPPLSFVGDEVSNLFEKAFSDLVVQSGRPKALDWVDALQKLEASAKRCTSDPGHWHPAQLTACPWCRMESLGANRLFPFVIPASHAAPNSQIDIEAMWRELKGLQVVDVPLSLSQIKVPPSVEAQKLYERKRANSASPNSIKLKSGKDRHRTIAAVFAVIGFVLAVPIFPNLFFAWLAIGCIVFYLTVKPLSLSSEIQKLSEAIKAESEELKQINDEIDKLKMRAIDAESSYRSARDEWDRGIDLNKFESAKRNFEVLREEVLRIPSKRNKLLDQLRQSQRKIQLDKFLDRFQIEDADIQGIGPGRKRTLVSYGIETAEDLTPQSIAGVPGFGPKMADRLLKWRRSLESKFVFDPSRAIDPVDINKVEQDVLSIRVKTENSAKSAFREALQSHSNLVASRKALSERIVLLQKNLTQIQADCELLNR